MLALSIVCAPWAGAAAFAVTPAPQAGARVSVFAGPPGGFGAVQVYDSASGALVAAPGALRGVKLLGIDFVGRTQLEEFLPERPRRFADLPGTAARLELPFDLGSLYRYQRLDPAGAHYGFLHVRPGAVPRPLFERLGTGSLTEDPFLDTVAVAPDGRSFLVATKPAAGGDLFEVPFTRGRVELRTAQLPPQDFARAGLWLAPGDGLGVSPQGVWRFRRAPGAQATAVPAPAGITWTGQAVLSRNGQFALATSGSVATAREAWVFTWTGAAVLASVAPAQIADAGFAPAFTSGPWLAISDDGGTAAWVETTVTQSPPASFRDVRVTQVTAPVNNAVVTGDLYLLDTLDEVGRLTFFQPGELAYAAGEVNDPVEGGLDGADFFSARLTQGVAPILRNLSATSGQTTPPFLTGIPTLTPNIAHLVPQTAGNTKLVLHDDDSEAFYSLALQSGSLALLESDVKSAYWVEPVGDWLVTSIERRSDPRFVQLHRMRRDLTGPTVVLTSALPPLAHTRPTARGTTLAWIESSLAGELVRRAYPGSLVVETWSSTLGLFTGPLSISAADAVCFARQAVNGAIESHMWYPGLPDVVLQHPLRPGHWLP